MIMWTIKGLCFAHMPFCWIFHVVALVLALILVMKLNVASYEPRHEKTGFLHMRKQRRRSASR